MFELKHEIELSMQDSVHIIAHVLVDRFDRNRDFNFEVTAIEHVGEFEDNALKLPVSLLSKDFVSKIYDQLCEDHTFEAAVLEGIEKAIARWDEREIEVSND